MWVAPADTLRSVYEEAALRISWAHPNPIYFLGQSFIGDPGFTYYLYTWAFKATPVVLVFALLALLYTVVDRAPLGAFLDKKRVAVGLIFAFVFFFTLQMMLGAKKMPRYLLPAFPMADILAGLGLATWADQISKIQTPNAKRHSALSILRSQFSILRSLFSHLRSPDPTPHSPPPTLRSGIPHALVAFVLLLQSVLILPRHPYYDTYFNELAGGARAGVHAISTQWQGEGLDIAARALNDLLAAGQQVAQQTAGSHKAVFFRQYFDGKTTGVDEPADWYVFGVSNVLEGGDREEEKVVDFYRRRQPWRTVSFDGIPYAWIYRSAAGPQNPAAFTFDPGIQLLGYDIPASHLVPSQTLRLQLHWQALEPQDEDYVVFVHLLSSADGHLVAQQDNPPVRGKKPTSRWKPGKVVVDPYDLQVPADTPPGEYVLSAGLYRWPDLSRLPVRGDEGVLLPDDRVLLATVRVEEQESHPFAAWIAWAMALPVLLSGVADLVVRRRNG